MTTQEKQNYIDQKIAEFDKKFVRRSVFGVSIGAIDSFAGSGEKQVHDFLTTALQGLVEVAKERVKNIGLEKERGSYSKMANFYRKEALDLVLALLDELSSSNKTQ